MSKQSFNYLDEDKVNQVRRVAVRLVTASDRILEIKEAVFEDYMVPEDAREDIEQMVTSLVPDAEEAKKFKNNIDPLTFKLFMDAYNEFQENVKLIFEKLPGYKKRAQNKKKSYYVRRDWLKMTANITNPDITTVLTKSELRKGL